MPTVLISKYNEARRLFDKMTRALPNQRPDCEQIIKLKKLWVLEENDFEFENEITRALNCKEENENSFIHIIMATKLENYIKEIKMKKE
jgi:hypothetical protein